MPGQPEAAEARGCLPQRPQAGSREHVLWVRELGTCTPGSLLRPPGLAAQQAWRRRWWQALTESAGSRMPPRSPVALTVSTLTPPGS